jgi:hypothetical protein
MKTFLKTILTLLTLNSYTLQSLEMPWYQQLFNNGTGVMYQSNCNCINTIENMRCIALSAYHRITNQKSNLQNEFTKIAEWILAEEQKALLAIKKKYNISNEICHKYLADLHRMKTICTKSMQKNNPDIIHDPNIPTDILEILTTLLEQNGINQHSIHIKMIPDQGKINEHSYTIARAKASINFMCSDTSEQNFILYRYTAPTIELFPPIIQEQSMAHKISTCAHEIQHLAQHHLLTQNILFVYLDHYCNVQMEEFKKTPEYHRLARIHEAQAEIFSAIKDPKIAECLKIKRQNMYYPDYLYEEHFFHLAYINTLWKVHK